MEIGTTEEKKRIKKLRAFALFFFFYSLLLARIELFYL
jgi:hypothetical protein